MGRKEGKESSAVKGLRAEALCDMWTLGTVRS